jgi:hypothetical protein
LKLIVRLKLPGVSPAILLQYLDHTVDLAFNSPTPIVKIAALELIEVFLLVFPSGVSSKLSDIRDILRTLIVESDQDIRRCAGRIYPLVFRCVSSNNAIEFINYLRNEIRTLQQSGLEALGDPLISSLSFEDLTS